MSLVKRIAACFISVASVILPAKADSEKNVDDLYDGIENVASNDEGYFLRRSNALFRMKDELVKAYQKDEKTKKKENDPYLFTRKALESILEEVHNDASLPPEKKGRGLYKQLSDIVAKAVEHSSSADAAWLREFWNPASRYQKAKEDIQNLDRPIEQRMFDLENFLL